LNQEREASPNSTSSGVEHALLAEEPVHSERALLDLFGDPQFDTQDSGMDVARSGTLGDSDLDGYHRITSSGRSSSD